MKQQAPNSSCHGISIAMILNQLTLTKAKDKNKGIAMNWSPGKYRCYQSSKLGIKGLI